MSSTYVGGSTTVESKPSKEAALDVSKVNDLLANLDNRLSGGLHGAFYESGSRLESTTRHGQLETLFELKAQLSEVQAGLSKQAQRAEAEHDKQTKGIGKPNASMISTFKAIVEQQMAEKLRDITIEHDRLKERVKKLEEGRIADQSGIAALKQKLKKREQPDEASKATEAKLKQLQSDIARIDQFHATKEEMGSLRRQILSMCSHYATKGELSGVRDRAKILEDTWTKNADLINNNYKKEKERYLKLKTDTQQRLQALETWRSGHERFHTDTIHPLLLRLV